MILEKFSYATKRIEILSLHTVPLWNFLRRKKASLIMLPSIFDDQISSFQDLQVHDYIFCLRFNKLNENEKYSWARTFN